MLLQAPLISRGADQETYGWGQIKVIPQDQYELKFLGVIVDKSTPYRRGLFLFIWKGDKTIHLGGNGFDKKNRFMPSTEFSIHHAIGWESLECEWEGPEEYYAIEPGKVSVFVVSTTWLEHYRDPSKVQGADQALLYVSAREGALFSKEFALPLTLKN